LFQKVSKYWEPRPRKRSKEALDQTDPIQPEHEEEPPNQDSSPRFSTPEKPIMNDEYLAWLGAWEGSYVGQHLLN